jgi:uncharacterized protein YkwD
VDFDQKERFFTVAECFTVLVHKPIAIMILPIFVAGILMPGILLAATARGQDDNASGGETQAPPPATETPPPTEAPPATETPPPTEAPPATETPPPTEAPPATETPPPTEAPPATKTPPPTEAPPATKTPPPAAPPAGAPQKSNTTGNAAAPLGATNNQSRADFVNTILRIHNRERAVFKLPPLVWNDTAAAHAKAWVEYLGAGKAGGKIVHCIEVKGWEQIEACTHHEGENIAANWPGSPAGNQSKLAQALTEDLVSDKPTGHYLQFVSRVTKSVGCGMITNGNLTAYYNGTSNILSCRYYPPGIDIAGCTENVPGCIARPPT